MDGSALRNPDYPAPVAADIASAGWVGAGPDIAVIVSTFRRPQYLAELVAALEAQTLDGAAFEVVFVDNGSNDTTFEVLSACMARTSLRARAVSLPVNRGPGGGRNAGFAHSRAPLVAITDDDCLPSPTWLAELMATFAAGADVIQGVVAPVPDEMAGMGAWDHTISILGPTPWFETSNVAYRRAYLDAVHGFDETDALTAQQGGGRAFGEDAVLGARVVAAGARRAWAADAVVYHRIVRSTYGKQFSEWRNLKGFPGLVRLSQVGDDSLYAKVFLNKETARFDLALAGGLMALVTRQPLFLAAGVSWAWRRWGPIHARSRNRAQAGWRLVQRGVLEAVGLASLVEGSFRYRKLVL